MSNKITRTNYYEYFILTTFNNILRIRYKQIRGFEMLKVLSSYLSINVFSTISGLSEFEIHHLLSIGMYDALRFKNKWYIKK